jgi:hypothetical protein
MSILLLEASKSAIPLAYSCKERLRVVCGGNTADIYEIVP